VLLDPQAVLLHHESASRGKPGGDPHPADTQAFRARYLHLLMSGDPCYSPLLSRQQDYDLNPFVAPRNRCARTVPVVLSRRVEEQPVRLPLRGAA
jgi:hypothetical protein